MNDASRVLFEHYGRPMAVMTDLESCLPEKLLREMAGLREREVGLPRELHDVHPTRLHVRTFLTIAQKHTTNFTNDEGIYLFNHTPEDHHLE